MIKNSETCRWELFDSITNVQFLTFNHEYLSA